MPEDLKYSTDWEIIIIVQIKGESTFWTEALSHMYFIKLPISEKILFKK